MFLFRHPFTWLLIAAAFLFGPMAQGENLSPLSPAPDWSQLDRFQETITHDDFARLLQSVYAPNDSAKEVIEIKPTFARILKDKKTGDYFTLRFAASEAARRPIARRWATLQSLPPKKTAGPLSDIRIALDPGHLGGEWAKMEERWFQIGQESPIQEGDLTLKVAQRIAPRLQSLGARVSFVREKLAPVTTARPDSFAELAKKILREGGTKEPREDFSGPADPEKEKSVRWQQELLFYRTSEIRARADLVNDRLRPDLVLCLHFNAEPWGDPAKPQLVDRNHLHLLVNGCYLPPELAYDDERFEMLRRLLSRVYPEEVTIAETIAETLAKKTPLPPYDYIKNNAIHVGLSGYVWARNLLATRLYECPTVYIEPYVMNSSDVYARVQAGDYEGTRKINGIDRPSIFREYADGVIDGLLQYYNKR